MPYCATESFICAQCFLFFISRVNCSSPIKLNVAYLLGIKHFFCGAIWHIRSTYGLHQLNCKIDDFCNFKREANPTWDELSTNYFLTENSSNKRHKRLIPITIRSSYVLQIRICFVLDKWNVAYFTINWTQKKRLRHNPAEKKYKRLTSSYVLLTWAFSCPKEI